MGRSPTSHPRLIRGDLGFFLSSIIQKVPDITNWQTLYPIFYGMTRIMAVPPTEAGKIEAFVFQKIFPGATDWQHDRGDHRGRPAEFQSKVWPARI